MAEAVSKDDAFDIELETWPDCPEDECPNKTCLWAGTGLCAPHSEQALGADELERRYRDTRAGDGSLSFDAFPGEIPWLEES